MRNKAIVYLDGADARIFKHLRYKLGSDERVQNAMILTGLLANRVGKSDLTSKRYAQKIKASFPELVGVSFEDFEKMLKAI
ncbi:MAG: hypothetical protein ACYCPP_08315 [Nitrososphaerales archaeon]